MATDRCISVHFTMPMQCLLAVGHRENWHEAELDGARYRYRWPSRSTQILADGEWQDYEAPHTADDDRKILAGAPKDSDDWDDKTWAAWFRHAERVHGTRQGNARTTDQITELKATREMAISRAVELENENARLTAELAETKASQDPRLRCLIVKAAPDKDMYVGWSRICDGPTGVWSRETALAYGFPRTRLDRADANGSSDLSCGNGHWDDKGWVADQRGWLRRDRLGDYAVEYLHGDREAAYALLEPFEDEAAS